MPTPSEELQTALGTFQGSLNTLLTNYSAALNATSRQKHEVDPLTTQLQTDIAAAQATLETAISNINWS